jgi:hypothetical protein
LSGKPEALTLQAYNKGRPLTSAQRKIILDRRVFEYTDGFGFMSNTYDPWDYAANAAGVGVAIGVEAIVSLASRTPMDSTTNV